MSRWKLIPGNLASPAGFLGAATAAGIKKKPGALDLALILSTEPATTAAGVFTTNLVAAAPVQISRLHLKKSLGRARAIVVNSGNANACTGSAGKLVATRTARAAARMLGIPPDRVLLASTGVIGVPMAAEAILNRLPELQARLSAQGADDVSQAILTTDTCVKTCVLESRLNGKTVRLAGIAKGSGMIHPRMATMLAFITTDAAISSRAWQAMLRDAAAVSFNRITVDGDTSTNDSVFALASGASGEVVKAGSAAGRVLFEGLVEVCQTLARKIAADGEGAKKLVTVEVRGAKTATAAERIARAIANSPLVKTALAGNDPNWGRILCAAGYSGAAFDPARVDIRVNRVLLCRHGLDAGFDEAAAKRQMDGPEVTLRIDLHQGRAEYQMWTCDLTHDYITINSSYRT